MHASLLRRALPAATLVVRGFTLSPVVGVPQGVSVFLDGVRVNEADAQQVHFDLLPFEAIDRAELTRGPSVLFGKNTLAGARAVGSGMLGPVDAYATAHLSVPTWRAALVCEGEMGGGQTTAISPE